MNQHPLPSRLVDDDLQNEHPLPQFTLSDHTLPVTDAVCGLGSFPTCRMLTASLDHTVKVIRLSNWLSSRLTARLVVGPGYPILDNDFPFPKADTSRRLGHHGTPLLRFFTRWIHLSGEPVSRTRSQRQCRTLYRSCRGCRCIRCHSLRCGQHDGA